MPIKANPEAIARAIAIETAEDEAAVGDFVTRIELGDNVYDYRFESILPGYELWQWAVSLYHDKERDSWTVNESSLVPTQEALMPPEWVPWKDRLTPEDLSVTDSLGTEANDERLEAGFRKTGSSEEADGTTAAGTTVAESSEEEVNEIVDEFRLSRHRVLSRIGRSKTAQRWYEGPHGPRSLSTKTAGGLTCETCGFFVPLKGELNMMFGVCANKWSPDDGRVVSLDHGCGEHSEIDPPQANSLWPDTKPVYDDFHIDVVKRAPREEAPQVEVIENLDDDEAAVAEELAQNVTVVSDDIVDQVDADVRTADENLGADDAKDTEGTEVSKE